MTEHKVVKSFEGKLYSEKKLHKAIFMIVGDAILVAHDHKSVKKPFKIICLQGLNINEMKDTDGFGI